MQKNIYYFLILLNHSGKLVGLCTISMSNSYVIQASIWTLSENCCIEFEIAYLFFQLAMAYAQILTTTLKPKNEIFY